MLVALLGRLVARLVVDKLPPGEKILLHDAGYVAWANSAYPMVDVVGLKSPKSIYYHRAYTSEQGQRGRALDHIARESGERYFIALKGVTGYWMNLPATLEQSGWKLQPMNAAEPGDYVLYSIDRKPGY